MKLHNEKENLVSGPEHSIQLWQKLKEKASSEPKLPHDYQIDPDIIKLAVGKYLYSLDASSSNPKSVIDYWLKHGVLAGNLMANFAKRYDRNVILYQQVGILHDVDYLMYPHDSDFDAPVHPAPICNFLLDNAVPAVVCLAIIEHAGYISGGNSFSSRMSAALSACDDLATFMSALSSLRLVDSQGLTVNKNMLSDVAIKLVNEVGLPVIKYPKQFTCSKRVLAHVDHFINDAFDQALGVDTGNFDV